MKIFLCVLFISLASIQEMVVAKRGGHGPRFDPNMCCNVEKSEPNSALHEEMKGLIDTCVKELGYDTEEGKQQRGKMVCISECVGKQMNVLDANGKLNEAEFLNLVNKMASGDHQMAAAEQVAATCLEEIKNSDDSDPKGDMKCGFTMMKAKMCIGREMFKACPEDKQEKEDEKCVKMREAINSGKFPHGRGPRPKSAESDD